jgi:hypothetical protein
MELSAQINKILLAYRKRNKYYSKQKKVWVNFRPKYFYEMKPRSVSLRRTPEGSSSSVGTYTFVPKY